MRLIIGSRKSDLARCQAYSVASAIRSILPNANIEFLFKSSAGDLDQDSLLTQMGDKGVFTQDFKQDLYEGRCDLVVHSWKDLPIESDSRTQVIATLPRADARDMLLAHPYALTQKRVKVLSSSPRREYNLKSFLPRVWPTENSEFDFTPVRGNVPTRIKKLMAGDGDALIVAKAALDRLLSASEAEFAETKTFLRSQLSKLKWMVLPLSANPTAAAQGALAIEIKIGRDELVSLLAKLNDKETMASVNLEREILASYGGGCHQKIGVSISRKSFGQVYVLKGLTTTGVVLDQSEIRGAGRKIMKMTDRLKMFGREMTKGWFQRERLPKSVWQYEIERAKDLFIAKADALPRDLEPELLVNKTIWCAGISTWEKLAQAGVWANGCQDSLGEAESNELQILLGRTAKWSVVTHEGAAAQSEHSIRTYRLTPKIDKLDLSEFTHFYWPSGSAFQLAWQLDSKSILKGRHACGPGKTKAIIENLLGESPEVFWSEQHWRKELRGEGNERFKNE